MAMARPTIMMTEDILSQALKNINDFNFYGLQKLNKPSDRFAIIKFINESIAFYYAFSQSINVAINTFHGELPGFEITGINTGESISLESYLDEHRGSWKPIHYLEFAAAALHRKIIMLTTLSLGNCFNPVILDSSHCEYNKDGTEVKRYKTNDSYSPIDDEINKFIEEFHNRIKDRSYQMGGSEGADEDFVNKIISSFCKFPNHKYIRTLSLVRLLMPLAFEENHIKKFITNGILYFDYLIERFKSIENFHKADHFGSILAIISNIIEMEIDGLVRGSGKKLPEEESEKRSVCAKYLIWLMAKYKLTLQAIQNHDESLKFGFDQKEFFIARIVSFLHLLIEHCSNAINPVTLEYENNKKKIKSILFGTYISYKIEMFMKYHQKAITEDNVDQSTLLLINPLVLGIQQSIVEHFDILDNIIIIPLAWKKHALYLQIKKEKEEVKYFIYNSGSGCDTMHYCEKLSASTTGGSRHVIYPYLLKFSTSTQPTEYLKEILSHSTSDLPMKELVGIFYNGQGKHKTKPEHEEGAYLAQPNNTCTSYGYLRAQEGSSAFLRKEIETIDSYLSESYRPDFTDSTDTHTTCIIS